MTFCIQLNQNTSISRDVTAAYIEDVQTVVLQRYVMAIFTYDIRHFGEAPKREQRKEPWGRH